MYSIGVHVAINVKCPSGIVVGAAARPSSTTHATNSCPSQNATVVGALKYPASVSPKSTL